MLGDLHLQALWDPLRAAHFYTQALEWCGEVRGLAEGARLLAVPEKAAQAAAPPAEWQQMNEGGVIRPRNIPEGAVINRTTATWYLDRLQAQLQLRLGFLRSLAGDWEGALTHWRRVTRHDPLLDQAQKRRYFNTLHRLEGCAKKGFYIGDAEDNRGLQARVRPAILWADFLFMTEQFQAADSLFLRLYTTAAEKNDATVAARAGLGRMFAAHHRADNLENAAIFLPAARAIGEEINRRWPKAPATAYAAFMIPHSTGTDSDGTYRTAVAGYRSVYERFPRSRFAQQARFFELYKGNFWNRMDWIEARAAEYRRDYPDCPLLKIVDSEVKEKRQRWVEHESMQARRAAEAAASQPAH